jgi:hypothetical protein
MIQCLTAGEKSSEIIARLEFNLALTDESVPMAQFLRLGKVAESLVQHQRLHVTQTASDQRYTAPNLRIACSSSSPT